MKNSFFKELDGATNILMAGAGGGFDVFCGLPLYFVLKGAGKTVHLANLSSGALGFCDAENPAPALWRITPATAAPKYFPEMYLAAWLTEREGDAVSLLAVQGLKNIPKKLLVCLGFGIDAHGGVCHAHFLENVSALSREDAYLGAWSLAHDSDEFRFYQEACEFTFSRLAQQPSIVNTSIIAAVTGR